MLYDDIIANYDKNEPIFLSELPENSKDYVRQEMKQVKEYISLFPDRVYRNIYHGGLMNELV